MLCLSEKERDESCERVLNMILIPITRIYVIGLLN